MATQAISVRTDDMLLEECAIAEDFPVELAHRLADTVRGKYAHLDRWGAKADLQRELADLIEKDVHQVQLADRAHDL